MYTTDYHILIRQEQVKDAIREVYQAREKAALLEALEKARPSRMGIVAWPQLLLPWSWFQRR